MALLRSEQYLKTGEAAPNFSLKGIDHQTHTLSEIDGPVLVVFMCNHCPFVIPKIPRLNDIKKKYEGKLTVIGINSNNNPEFPEDSFEKMKKMDVDFLYLFDETQEVAKAYGAVCTPDPFLLDKEKNVYYHGRIDNAMSPEDAATEYDMELHIDNMLVGKPPATDDFTPSQGCSIKWQ